MANCDNCVGCSDDAEIHRLCDDCMQEQIREDEERHAAKDAEIASLRAEVERLMADNARLRQAMPSDRVLLMFSTAIHHHPLFSQPMRDECVEAIARLDAARSGAGKDGAT